GQECPPSVVYHDLSGSGIRSSQFTGIPVRIDSLAAMPIRAEAAPSTWDAAWRRESSAGPPAKRCWSIRASDPPWEPASCGTSTAYGTPNIGKTLSDTPTNAAPEALPGGSALV